MQYQPVHRPVRRPISISRHAIRLQLSAIALHKTAWEVLIHSELFAFPRHLRRNIFIILSKRTPCIFTFWRRQFSARGNSRRANQFTINDRNYARHPMDKFRAALVSSRIATTVRSFLPFSRWVSRSLLPFLRHDDRHFRSIALRRRAGSLALFLSSPSSLPPPPHREALVSVRNRRVVFAGGAEEKNRVNRDSVSTRLRFLTFSPPAYVARRMQLQYNYPPSSARLPPSRPLTRRSLLHRLFSRFRERDSSPAQLPASRKESH